LRYGVCDAPDPLQADAERQMDVPIPGIESDRLLKFRDRRLVVALPL
jgi:hypothetical protein